MLKVLSKEMMKEADSYTISNITTEEELINKAGEAVFSSSDFLGKTLIVIGKGNNGADGLALAKLLKENNHDVEVLQIFDIERPILLSLLADSIERRIKIYRYNDEFSFLGYSTIVDAIYGIGFHGEIDEPVKTIIKKINSINSYVISIDINSGLDSNSGKASYAIKSDKTVAIGYIKPGHILNDAKDYINELSVVNIGIPYSKESYYLYTEKDLKKVFKARKNNSNKSTYGYVGVMGGSYMYSGSIKLSNLALIALSVGAGVTRIICPDSISDSILPFLLESTMYPVSSTKRGGFDYNRDEILSSIKGLKALGFGMGIGREEETKELLKLLLEEYDGKLLIDADGLYQLSMLDDLNVLNRTSADVVLTPHVLEFSRIIKVPVDEILKNPIFYVKEFTKKDKSTLVLKGTASIISKDGIIYLSSTGTMSLSKGGSGDILSGIITGIMGYDNALNASLAGCYVLGLSGNIAYQKYGSYATLSRDIINILKDIMKKY